MKQQLSRKELRKAKKQQKKKRRQNHQNYNSQRKTQEFIQKVQQRQQKYQENQRNKEKEEEENQFEENFMDQQEIDYEDGLDGEEQELGDLMDEELMREYEGMEEIDENPEGYEDIEEFEPQGMGEEEDVASEEIEDEDEKQIRLYQKKLGISKKTSKSNKYQKIARGMGFDDDLFSFLDNISKKVKQAPKQNKSKTESKKSTELSKKQAKTKKKLQKKQRYEQQQQKKKKKIEVLNKQKQNVQKIEKTVIPISEQTIKIRKSMNGLFNRISDGNLNITLREFISIFQSNPKGQTMPIFAQLFTKFNLLVQKPLTHILTANIVITVGITMIYGPRIMALIIKQLINEYLKLQKQQQNIEEIEEIGYSKLFEKKKNFMAIICYFYQFGAITADFILSLIHNLCSESQQVIVSPQKIQYLYIILQKCGQRLRNNDTSVLKLILEVMKDIIAKSKENNLYETTKIKFIEIQINQIKFNRKSVFDADQRMGFLHTFLNKSVSAEAPILQNKQYMLVLTYQQILNADANAPQWWQETGNNFSSVGVQKQYEIKIEDSEEIRQLKELAKKYRFVTETRRNIFVELMSSKDYIEATQKILELKVKRLEQIAVVLVETNIRQPEIFNPFYSLVAAKICEQIPKFRVSLQFAIWDRIKQLQNYGKSENNIRKISNLGKFVGWILSSEYANCSLTILKYFTDLANLSVYESMFVKVMFKQLFRKITKNNMIKLLRKLKDQKNRGIRINLREYLNDLQEEYEENVKKCKKQTKKQNEDILKSLKFMIKMIMIQEDEQLELE